MAASGSDWTGCAGKSGSGPALRRRENDRAAGSQRIGRGTGGGADNQAVAAIAGQQFAIDVHIQFDQPGGDAAADDNIVESGLLDPLPLTLPVACKSDRDSNLNSPFQTCFRAWGNSEEGTAVRKPRLPMLMPKHRECGSRRFRGRRAESCHRRQIPAARSTSRAKGRRRRGRSFAFRPASRAVCSVAVNLASRRELPACAASRTTAERGDLLGVSDQSDSLDFVSQFFQSAPKIPYCPRAQAPGIP